MSKKILFITKVCDQCDIGFPYVLEFAKTLNKQIEILVIQPKNQITVMEDIFAAAAFAEEGDLKSMKEIMQSRKTECIETLEQKIRSLNGQVDSEIILHAAEGDIASAVNALLKDRPCLDMVFISPVLSEKTTSLNIKKMLKKISKPIVHISRPVAAGI